jgi:hypothetical protein
MELAKEINILQEELNRSLIENECSNDQIIELSKKLDTLIMRYYLEDENIDK